VPESGPVMWPLEAQRGYGRGTTASEGQRRTEWHTWLQGHVDIEGNSTINLQSTQRRSVRLAAYGEHY
jgi:hypothetical protein